MDTDHQEELTMYSESLFNIKKEDIETAKAAAKAGQNSWTKGDTESEATDVSTEVVSEAIKN